VRLERGPGWRITWSAGHAEQFDAVVCASGFHKPRFRASRTGVEIAPSPWASPSVEPTVSADLRMTLPETEAPDRIWTLGVSSYLGTPLVNAVYQAARQAEAVARQLAASRPHLRDEPEPARMARSQDFNDGPWLDGEQP
jgi:hypothetical protein